MHPTRTIVLDSFRSRRQLVHVANRAREVAALRQTRIPRGQLKTTSLIIQANEEIWPGDEARATQTKGIWQAGSGDAHALGWSILTRQYEMTPMSSGLGQFVGDASMLDVANAYLCAYDFVAYGFHRLEELGGERQIHREV